jgi:hypothetical protein
MNFFILVTYLVLLHCVPSLLGDPPVLIVIEQAMLSQCRLESRLGENVACPLQEFLDAEKKPCNEEKIPNYLLFGACIWYLPAIKE